MAFIETKGLRYRYGGSGYVLNGLDISISSGETVGIIGPSGSGKTTLCLCLCGVIPHHFGGSMVGDVLINGRNTRTVRPSDISIEVGMVFQDPETQVFMPTVEDEIAFGPENMCIHPSEIRNRVHECLELLGINHLATANPARLSGGEQQLVVVASALALGPPALILDECTAQLDTDGAALVLEAIRTLKSLGKTIIMIEHNPDRLWLMDRAIWIDKGQALMDGPSEEVVAAWNASASKT